MASDIRARSRRVLYCVLFRCVSWSEVHAFSGRRAAIATESASANLEGWIEKPHQFWAHPQPQKSTPQQKHDQCRPQSKSSIFQASPKEHRAPGEEYHEANVEENVEEIHFIHASEVRLVRGQV
jgi:hypothetical protein